MDFRENFFFFFFSCAGSSLLQGFSLVVESGGYSLVAGRRLLTVVAQSTGSRRTGFSSGSSRALEHRLCSCGAWIWLLLGIWDLPGSGIEPVSRALAGRFLTTEPPGKPGLSPFIAQWLHTVGPMCGDTGFLLCSLVHDVLVASSS